MLTDPKKDENPFKLNCLTYLSCTVKFFNSSLIYGEAIVQRCSVKKVFLEISKNSQENTCARVSFLIKLQAFGLRPATLLKKRLWYTCFPVNFVKFLRAPFFIEHLWWLVLFMLRISKFSDAATGGVLQKYMFLKIWQISQENILAGSSF